MQTKKLIIAALIPAVLVGCASPVPVAQNFPRTYQKVARTAQHWDVVAKDVIEQTEKMVAKSERLKSRDFYVPVNQRNSFFDSTFREFLIDHMVAGGMPVVACPPNELLAGFQPAPEITVQYETRVVRHAEMPTYKPGMLTVLATGIYALNGIASLDSLDARIVGGIAGIAAVDTWIAQMPKETRTELIVTATIQEGNRFIMRRSLIYYVPDGDIDLFASRRPSSSNCGKGKDAMAGTTGHVAGTEDRETEMNRLRAEKVERDMIRFNDHYRPAATPLSKVKFFY